MRPIALAVLAVLLVLPGCTEENTDFTVQTRDGVPHAINRGINVWSDSAEAPIQFTREQTYGTNEGSGPALLGGIAGLAVDSAATVYVLDRENHRLVAFAPDGTVRWAAGRQGEGPGEFQNPWNLIVRNQRLYVGNNSGQQIDVWTTSGNFVEQEAFEGKDLGRLNLVGFANDLLVVSESGYGDADQWIRALDTKTWEISRSFPVELEVDLPKGVGVSPSVTTIDNRLYVAGLSTYTLRVYNLEGSVDRSIVRNVDFIRGPATMSGANRGIRSYSRLGAPIQLPDGHLLVNAWWASNVEDPEAHYRKARKDNAKDIVPAIVLDLFAPNGRYRGSLRWTDRFSPPMGNPSVVGPNGKVYATTPTPYPQVRRYDVRVEDR